MDKPASIPKTFIQQDAWAALKKFTDARIAIGRAGHAAPLAENLLFRADHARARDAVYSALNVQKLADEIQPLQPLTPIILHTAATTRQQYLQRPDLGRRLNVDSHNLLKNCGNETGYDVAVIIADGLSAHAVELHALSVLQQLLPLLQQASLSIAPLCIVQQARVAVSDEIGSLLNSRLSLLLIGERPGLSSPHSMGIYITYHPTVGNTDETRNCISNIHPQGGLSYTDAATQAFSLIKNSFALKLSGVHLKSHKALGH